MTDENTVIPWNQERLQALYLNSSDVIIRSYQLNSDKQSEIVFIYCEGLTDTAQIGKVIMPQLEEMYLSMNGFSQLKSTTLYSSLPIMPVAPGADAEQLSEWLFEGQLLLLFPTSGSMLRININNRPERTPDESSTEISIKGPRDGFVESLSTNVALIRKRVRSQSLCYEAYVIGTRTRTKVGILYFKDILNPNILLELRNRFAKINMDGLISIHQLEDLLSDDKYSIFPLLDYTGRPDKAVNSLLAGRFIIIVDGNPHVLIGPANLSLLIESPEDLHFNFQYVTFARLIRMMSFGISIIMPGAWVALSAYHPDQIPFRLLATVASGRLGLPFSAQIELLILLLMLEMFREAGLRLPSTIGQTLTVVGGLIIGDAAIRAGLVSPSVVVVGAITAVAGVTLVNQSLSGAISVIRIIIFLFASFLGMYGLMIAIVLLIGYMSRLTSFGIPFLSPISPPIFRDLLSVIFRMPTVKQKKRPEALHTIDKDRKGDDDNEEKD